MKTAFWLLLALLLAVTTLTARPVSNSDAVTAAIHWLNPLTDRDISNEMNTIMLTSDSNGVTLFYTCSFEQGGFVLVAADDTSIPVLGYDTSAFVATDNPAPAFQWFINNYKRELNWLTETQASTSETRQQWDRLLANPYPHEIFRDVLPLLSTEWNQDNPWNSACPTANSGPGGHMYAGCVAVSMAQIMKYWQHPTQGVGSNSYYLPGYGTVSANFGTTTYQYNQMQNTTSTPATELLLFHCGVAADMDYHDDGSGAYSSDAANALRNNFLYSSALTLQSKDDYTNIGWESLLCSELEAGRPLYYGGDSNTGGHAWVCDGYQNNNYFHMNWGWSGTYNGYYYLNNLNPDNTSPFDSGQEAMIGVEPVGAVHYPPTNLIANVVNTNNIQLDWNAPDIPDSVLYADGFETGDFSTWDNVIQGFGQAGIPGDLPYWNVSDEYVHEGAWGAAVDWGYSEDTWLISPSVSCTADTYLNFMWIGNYYWSVQPNDNCDMFVKVSSDGGNTWTEIWTYGNIGAWTDWTWYETTLDLGAYVGQSIQIAFNVVGNDNADTGLDNVTIATGDGGIVFGTVAIASITNANPISKSIPETTQMRPPTRNVIGYKVYYDDCTLIATITDPSVTTYLDENLDYGPYYYYVTALYDDGVESINSNVASAVISLPLLMPPRNLTADLEESDIVHFNWDFPDITDLSEVTGWGIYYGDGTLIELLDTQLPAEYFHTLTDTGIFYFYVTARYGASGESPPSNIVSIVTVDTYEEHPTFVTKLSDNYPNPFNPETNISFSLKDRTFVEITVYNLMGREVTTLHNSVLHAGNHNVIWTGTDDTGKAVASGVYFYRMKSGRYTSTKKMILLK
ncbi:MAG: C10 family peptidase [Candidatus Cloacimonetes bacterium]|nr:C10 family peptidase [Candidatus Cloacimonadota bacterium]